MYGILDVKVNLHLDEFFETPVNPHICGHRFEFHHQLFHLARRKFAFPLRIVDPWSKLPHKAVDAAPNEIFKLRLDMVWDTLLVSSPSLGIQHICF